MATAPVRWQSLLAYLLSTSAVLLAHGGSLLGPPMPKAYGNAGSSAGAM